MANNGSALLRLEGSGEEPSDGIVRVMGLEYR